MEFEIKQGVLLRYKGSQSTVILPDSVKEIGDYAFSNNSKISEVNLSATSCVRIGKKAFRMCVSLKKVYLPESLREIDDQAFTQCMELELIDLPQRLEQIGEHAFHACIALQTVIFPISLEKLGKNAFSSCVSLRRASFTGRRNLVQREPADLEGKLKAIQEETFRDCKKLDRIRIPRNITEIKSNAFLGCTGLKQIEIEAENCQLSDEAFSDCIGLMNDRKMVIVRDVLYKYCGEERFVIVPNGIRKIGKRAFENVKTLEGICLPQSLISIGKSAFSNCGKLLRVELPENVRTLDSKAFFHCDELRSFGFPRVFEAICGYAFGYCKKLKAVRMPEVVYSVYETAFFGCQALADSSGMLILRNGLFGYFGTAHEITIPEEVSVICHGAFFNCKTLEEVHFGECLRRIGDMAFAGCSSLREIEIPQSVKTLGSDAFSGCSGLESVTIRSENLDNIKNAFYDCRALIRILAPKIPITEFLQGKIGLPAAIGYLEHPELFADPQHPESVQCVESYQRYLSSQRKRILKVLFEEDLPQALLYYADNGKITAENYRSEYFEPAKEANATQCVTQLMNWRQQHLTADDFDRVEERELLRSPFSAAEMKKTWMWSSIDSTSVILENYKGTETTVYVPEKIGRREVAALGSRSFSPERTRRTEDQREALRDLKEVVLPQSICMIAEEAFYECRSLEKITIPETLTSIGGAAFKGCRALADDNGFVIINKILFDDFGIEKNIILPETIREISDMAFEYRKRLVHVTLPSTLFYIGANAFRGCNSLIRLELPKALSAVGKGAFSGCANLRRIVFSDSMEELPENVLGDCGKLYSVCLPQNLKHVRPGAMQHCYSIKELTFPKGLETIGGFAFYRCIELCEVRLPASVQRISEDAFAYCDHVVLIAPKGSYAEQYAISNGLDFRESN